MVFDDIGQIIGLVIAVIVGLPLVFGIFSMTHDAAVNKAANLTVASELISQAATPWWLGILTSLASVPVIGGILAVGFLFFLRWTGHI